MKKSVMFAAVATALTAASSASFAAGSAYSTTFTNLTGNFVISGFGVDSPTAGVPTAPDADKSFSVTLSQVNGKVTIEVPVASEYKFVAKAGSQMLVDFDGVPGPDLGAVYGANTVIGSGPLSVTNTSTKLVEFDFGNFNGAGSTSLKLDGVSQALPYTTGNITVSGAGATTLFGSLFGLSSFLSGPVSGTVDIDYTLSDDTIVIDIDETNLVGGSFENILLALDNMTAGQFGPFAAGNRNGIIDGNFFTNGVITAVPEPTSMALIGLGLAGLAAVRRRKAA